MENVIQMLMRGWESYLLIAAAYTVAALLFRLAAVLDRLRFNPSAVGGPPGVDDAEGNEDGREELLGDELLIDIASRYNEAIIANIDAVDLALFAVIGANVAFDVFAIDKATTIGDTTLRWSIWCTIASLALSLIGYMASFWTRDGIAPKQLLARLADSDEADNGGEEALGQAISALVVAGVGNRRIRSAKRALALLSLLAFLGAAYLVVTPLLHATGHKG